MNVLAGIDILNALICIFALSQHCDLYEEGRVSSKCLLRIFSLDIHFP